MHTQITCCCSILRSAQPRRRWKLISIGLEHLLQRSASWALHGLCYLHSPIYSGWCPRWAVAALSELERCVTPVSVRMDVY